MYELVFTEVLTDSFDLFLSTFGAMTFSVTTLSITTFSIMTLSTICLFATFSIIDT
jgi:hypothetical protein